MTRQEQDPPVALPGTFEVNGTPGSRQHDAQNALARAICLIEETVDDLEARAAGRDGLARAITEIENAGRLIAEL